MEKVVFVTGASRGIGAATVEKFLKEGWRVVGFYKENKMQDTENARYFQMDISSLESIEDAIKHGFEAFGRVDCLVNCAGIFGYKTLEQYDLETMEKVVATNEVGMYLITQNVIKYLKEGSIVLISSTAAQVGSNDPIYAGTKAAVLGFTKSMAKALAPDIRINCIAPGVTESDMVKNMNPERVDQLINMSLMKKIATRTDIANGIYFLASEQAGHITGACLDINGGYVLR